MIKLEDGVNLSGYTFILPSVAVGNVAQLTIDLIISTLELRRIGRMFDTAFIPIVGANPFDDNSEDICTALDFYASDEKEIVVLQIRSPITKKPVTFMHEIKNFICDHQIARTIILTSSFSHERKDADLRTAPFRYIATDIFLAKYGDKFKDLSWIALEPMPINELNPKLTIRIHGGGFAKILYQFFEKNNIPCLIVFKYCSEGDNIPDAIELLNHFNQWAQLVPTDENNLAKHKVPTSWKFLYGNPPPKEIY